MDAKRFQLRRSPKLLDSPSQQYIGMRSAALFQVGFNANPEANGSSAGVSWKSGGLDKGNSRSTLFHNIYSKVSLDKCRHWILFNNTHMKIFLAAIITCSTLASAFAGYHYETINGQTYTIWTSSSGHWATMSGPDGVYGTGWRYGNGDVDWTITAPDDDDCGW
jgi:hypothetical protein